MLVNGTVWPILYPEKDFLRLQFLNASNARYYCLAPADYPLHLVATDGGLIDKPVELTELLLAPVRAEVLVRLDWAGDVALHNRPYDPTD